MSGFVSEAEKLSAGMPIGARVRLVAELVILRRGIAWLVAALLAFAAALIAFGWRDGVRAELAATEKEMARFATGRTPAAPAMRSGDDARLQQLDILLPRADRLDEQVRNLYAIAGRAQLPIGEAQFTTIDDAPTGLRRLTVTLPVKGRYGHLREFIDTALHDLPNMSLDEIALAGKSGQGAPIDARLRLSLWGRPADGLHRGPAPREALSKEQR